jgi:hypothetical protein
VVFLVPEDQVVRVAVVPVLELTVVLVVGLARAELLAAAEERPAEPQETLCYIMAQDRSCMQPVVFRALI